MSPTNGEACELEILLVDDLPLRRAGLHRLLKNWCGQVCRVIDAQASDIVSDTLVLEAEPRLAILSIGASAATSEEVRETFEHVSRRLPGVPVVVISDRNDHADIVASLHAGARGFITTDLDPEIMFGALRFILGGGVFFPPDALLRAPSPGAEAPVDPAGVSPAGAGDESLTGRQADVLNLLRQGHSNKRIAIRLGMRESTVKAHVRQIMRKLGASNRTQAALSSMQLGIAQQAFPPLPTSAAPVPAPASAGAATTSDRAGRSKGVVGA